MRLTTILKGRFDGYRAHTQAAKFTTLPTQHRTTRVWGTLIFVSNPHTHTLTFHSHLPVFMEVTHGSGDCMSRSRVGAWIGA